MVVKEKALFLGGAQLRGVRQLVLQLPCQAVGRVRELDKALRRAELKFRPQPGRAARRETAEAASRAAKVLTAGRISRRAMARAVLPSMVTSLQYSSCLISSRERSSA